MTTQQVVNLVKTSLYADTGAGGVATLTSNRIYEAEGPDNAALPLVVYLLASDAVNSTFGDDTGFYEFQFDCYGARSLGMLAVRTLAERVKTLLNRVALSGTGVVRLAFQKLGDGMESTEEDACRITLRFRAFAS